MSDLPDLSMVISQLCFCSSSVYTTMYLYGKQMPGALRRVRITVCSLNSLQVAWRHCITGHSNRKYFFVFNMKNYDCVITIKRVLYQTYGTISSIRHPLCYLLTPVLHNVLLACVHFNKSVKLTFVSIYYILHVETDHACKHLQLRGNTYFKADTISLLLYFVCALLKISSGMEDNQT